MIVITSALLSITRTEMLVMLYVIVRNICLRFQLVCRFVFFYFQLSHIFFPPISRLIVYFLHFRSAPLIFPEFFISRLVRYLLFLTHVLYTHRDTLTPYECKSFFYNTLFSADTRCVFLFLQSMLSLLFLYYVLAFWRMLYINILTCLVFLALFHRTQSYQSLSFHMVKLNTDARKSTKER